MNAIRLLLSSRKNQAEHVWQEFTEFCVLKMLKNIPINNLALARQPKTKLINIIARPLFSMSTSWSWTLLNSDLQGGEKCISIIIVRKLEYKSSGSQSFDALQTSESYANFRGQRMWKENKCQILKSFQTYRVLFILDSSVAVSAP